MGRQRNNPQTKEMDESLEKELNEFQESKLSNLQFCNWITIKIFKNLTVQNNGYKDAQGTQWEL